jgi:hypothetical protein
MEEIKWYLRPGMVLVLLFLVLGPFALPLLYKSPRFNSTWKIILTALVLVYTAYLVVTTFNTSNQVMQSFL